MMIRKLSDAFYEDYKEEVAQEARHAFAKGPSTEQGLSGSPIVDESSHNNHKNIEPNEPDPFAVLYEHHEEEEAVTTTPRQQGESLPAASDEEPVNLLDDEPTPIPSEASAPTANQQKVNQQVIQKPMPVGGDDGWPDPSGGSPHQEDEERRDSQFIDLIDDDEMF